MLTQFYNMIRDSVYIINIQSDFWPKLFKEIINYL